MNFSTIPPRRVGQPDTGIVRGMALMFEKDRMKELMDIAMDASTVAISEARALTIVAGWRNNQPNHVLASKDIRIEQLRASAQGDRFRRSCHAAPAKRAGWILQDVDWAVASAPTPEPRYRCRLPDPRRRFGPGSDIFDASRHPKGRPIVIVAGRNKGEAG